MPSHLFIDADDTLWENNVYFERVLEEFLLLLDHPSLAAVEVRAVLDEIERVNNRVHGYGAANFARNLRQCYERLSPRGILAADVHCIAGFGDRLANHPIEMLEGVEETLAYLSGRHVLTLLTKGDPAEQEGKLRRSGLGGYFTRTLILREKNTGSYRAIVGESGLGAEGCWMIGNSPKSDINPALEAGLGAVYIPHPHTWRLEDEQIRDGHGRLLVLDRFADLRKHF